MSTAGQIVGDEWPPRPTPVPGCLRCTRLSDAWDYARETGDGSAESDANVLLRQHYAADHP